MTTPPSSSSRLPRPTLPRSSPSTSSTFKYVSTSSPSNNLNNSTSSKSSKSRSRSKSSLSQPKILPFPELSLRAQEAQKSSREGSRATSPLSTPPIDRLEVTFDQMVSMSRVTSSEGYNNNNQDRRSSGSQGGGNSSGNNTIPGSSSNSILVGSTSPPIPSPLALSAARLSRARASTVPSRPRTPGNASDVGTGPSSGSPPTIGPPIGRSIPSPSPVVSANRRTEGFRPASPALARVTTNVPSTSARPTTTHHASSALPTISASQSSAPLRTIPTVLAPPTPVTPAKHHAHHHQSHTTHTSSSQTSSTTSTTVVTPLPSSQHIKDHLYHSFLKGVCADIRLVIRKWGVCYHVHKVILAQTSFFHTLFLGGFSETHHIVRRSGKGKEKAGTRLLTDEDWNGEDVELTFDDPNITRAAFEICLSRLYSSYPHLHFPTELLPTATHPLTPSFPNITSVPNYRSLQESLPSKAHLATPRLLLSLLATTIYLGHGILMREVLAIILRTVGPLTVRRYLSFATGDGIEAEEYSGQSEEGVQAFSGLAKSIQGDSEDNSFISRQTSDEDLVEEALHTIGHSPRSSSDSGMKVSDSSKQPSRYGGIPIPSLKLPSRSNSIRSQRTIDDPFSFTSADERALPHYYGVVGNKIGETCCCWLARWGVDLLNAEMEIQTPAYRIWAHGGLPANLVRAILSSDYFFVTNEMERYRFARKILDLRRSGWDDEMEDGGDLSLAASSGIQTDDDDGWEEWEEEEREILKTFAEGIYYCHMTFDDLSTIASDIDSSTHLPYAPLAVLQAAHWAAADLRSRVTAHEKLGTPPSADDENELGLTQTTTAICTSTRRRRPGNRSRVPSPAITSSTLGSSSPSSTLNSLGSLPSSQHTIWHAVPTDETHKIGASGLLSLSASNQHTTFGDMPDFGPDPLDPLSEPASNATEKSRTPPHGERTAFGLIGGKMSGKEIEEKWINEGGSFAFSGLGLNDSPSIHAQTQDQKLSVQDERWSKIEPFRFSVEFFNVDKLTEKERFYSETHFYAGSYFNCYVQMIKRKEKGVQLGVYLHRQSPNEPFPIPSSPRRTNSSSPSISTSATLAPPTASSSRIGNSIGTSPTSHNRNLSTSPMVPGSPPTILPGTLGLSSPPTTSGGLSSNQSNNEPPYIDSRSVTKAFFSISCASALGTALIRFTSGPDCFALSQSWGWKSSALKSEEYISTPPRITSTSTENQNQNVGDSGDGDIESNLEEGVLGWSGEIPNSSLTSKIGQCSLRATVVVGVV